MKRRSCLVVAVALGLVLGGCGIPTQQSATKLPHALQLLPSASTLPVLGGVTGTVTVYFIKDGRLYPVPYPEQQGSPLSTAITALSLGPSYVQTEDGITTGFSETPAEISLLSTPSQGGLATVEVDDQFLELQGTPALEAYAQVVYTLTGIPGGPKSVQFESQGVPLEAFIPPGRLVSRPVTRSDYCELAPIGTNGCAAGPSGSSS